MGRDEEEEKHHVLEQMLHQGRDPSLTCSLMYSKHPEQCLAHSKLVIDICSMNNLVCQDEVNYLTHQKNPEKMFMIPKFFPEVVLDF